MGRGMPIQSFYFQIMELRARMIQETGDYLAVRLPGRGAEWSPDHIGRKAGIGQRARKWKFDRLPESPPWPAIEESFS